MVRSLTVDDFWQRVRKTGTCWLWTGHITKRGYGGFKKSGKAHRYSWEIHNGPIPSGLCVCHRCDVRNCVNPAHLFLGTVADNNADREAKGRGKPRFGEEHKHAKLSVEKVIEIRRLHKPYVRGHSARALAKRFGVEETTIHSVVKGKTWRHATA